VSGASPIGLTAVAMVLTVALPATSASADDQTGTLKIYDLMSEIGTVACREFRDDAGRLTRVIYYTTRAPALKGPFDPNDLIVQSSETYDYDQNGRKIRSSTFDGNGILNGYAICRYNRFGDVLDIIDFTADGRKQYEMRYTYFQRPVSPTPASTRPTQRLRTLTELDFDDAGERIIGVTGPLPDDLPPSWEWGPPAGGWRCAIAPCSASATREKMKIEITMLNADSAPKDLACGLGSYRPTLRAADGKVVPIAEDSKGARWLRERGSGSCGRVRIDEARRCGTLELARWYPNLPPGLYSLQLEYRGDRPDWFLVSNTVSITIVEAGSDVDH
jgi:hypothetical protein